MAECALFLPSSLLLFDVFYTSLARGRVHRQGGVAKGERRKEERKRWHLR